VLDKDAFNLARILEIEPAFLNESHDHGHDFCAQAFRR
jgi:hypothetical protein